MSLHGYAANNLATISMMLTRLTAIMFTIKHDTVRMVLMILINNLMLNH